MSIAATFRRVAFGSILGALASAASAQNTWYVDAAAVPPGSGTQAAPYASIQYAIDRATTQNGDTILVAPGLYVENVKDDAKWVVVRSTQGPLATELRPLNPGEATVYYTHGSTVEGFTLTGNPSNHLNGGALNLEVSTAVRCIVRDNSGLGVYSYSATLKNCTIVGPGPGIAVEFFSAITLRNTIVKASFWPGAMGTFADYCAGTLPAGTIGVGNVAGETGLWNIAGSHYRLRPGSPCIDAGDPNSPLDPDGTRADIGALPFDPTFSPTPVTYCAGKPNSDGCVPAIGAFGAASATSGGPFGITASNEVANKPGLLLLALGAGAAPFQGGTLCLASPIKRLGAQTSGGAGPCTGSYAFDMGAYLASGAHAGLVPGAQAYCQWWNRDPLDPAGFGSGLSNGLVFGVAP
jgi:hypothetical protein